MSSAKTVGTVAVAGTGVAGRAMKWLTALADQHGVTILLKPFATSHQRLSTKQLRAWYTRLGFHPIRGSDSMVRLPLRNPK